MGRFLAVLPIAVLLPGFVGVAFGQASGPCAASIREAERSEGLPPRLLGAIGLVESGRPDPVSGRAASWPWTINVEGQGRFFATKAEALAAVESALAKGIRSIDVGCMQINLLHHPAAFASLGEAFEPQANALYAARFLKQLHAQSGSWPSAAAAYHSQTPGRAEDYQRRVVETWSPSLLPSLTGRTRFEPSSAAYSLEFARVLAADAALRAARAPKRASRPSSYTPEFAQIRALVRQERAKHLAEVIGSPPRVGLSRVRLIERTRLGNLQKN
jgi:hypothetical protein